MRGPANFTADMPSREWYEPPDWPEEEDGECEQDESDARYENERDLAMELAAERKGR